MTLSAGTPVEIINSSVPVYDVKVTDDLLVVIAGNEARFADISGGSLGAGDLGSVDTYTAHSPNELHAVLMDSDEILVVYEAFGDTLYAVRLTLNLVAQTISHGSPVTIDTAASSINTPRCTKLSTTKAFLVWNNQSVGGHGHRAYGVTLTYPGLSKGTIDYISYDNPTTFTDPGFFETSCVALDSGRVYATYDSNASGSDGQWYGVVLTVGATTFNRGTEAVLDSDNFADGADSLSNRDTILFATDKVIAVSKTMNHVAATTISDIVSPGSLLNINVTKPGLDYADINNVIVSYDDSGAGKIQTLGLSVTTLTDNGDAITFATTTFFNIVPVRMGGEYAVVAYSSSSASKSYVVLISGVPSAAPPVGAGPAIFYQGAGTLAEKFSLPFSAVKPGAMTIDKTLGTVVLGAAAPAGQVVFYADHPYATGTSSDTGLPTGISITGLRWI